MIKPGEIQNEAREVGVRDQQIEKDYILSWILQGVAQHKVLSNAIVFKGGTVKRVKVDISRSEQLQFEPVKQNAILGYSDLEEHQLLCYSLEEVLLEKLRCTMQRMEARDFYDIWYLTEVQEIDVAFHSKEFRAKCESKGIDPSAFHQKMRKRLPQYKGRWKNLLLRTK